MKKLIYLLSAILLVSCSQRYSEETIPCVVTEVEYIQPGKISVAQLDLMWSVKTECNLELKTRRQMKVGDTIIIKKLRPLP